MTSIMVAGFEEQVTLQSSDGVVSTCDRAAAERSTLIKDVIGDLGVQGNEPIPIMNVKHNVLKKVIEWCKHHKAEPSSTENEHDAGRKAIDDWDQKFRQVDKEMLFEIILAANYMDIKALLDLGCKTVANMILGMSQEEIRRMFDIENDFTPEEEEQIRHEIAWAAT